VPGRSMPAHHKIKPKKIRWTQVQRHFYHAQPLSLENQYFAYPRISSSQTGILWPISRFV